jgi:predicted HTH domain antitoxin
MSVTLELPDDIGQRLLDDPGRAEPAVRLELAIALYRSGKLPPGRAAQLADLDRWEFEKVLVARQVEIPMSAEAVAEEVQNALRRC